MRTIKAVCENGQIVLPGEKAPKGRVNVVVTILDEETPRSKPSAVPRDKNAGREFVRRWRGILKGESVEGWQDQKAQELIEKRKRT
jgi:hypothetical protein